METCLRLKKTELALKDRHVVESSYTSEGNRYVSTVFCYQGHQEGTGKKYMNK